MKYILAKGFIAVDGISLTVQCSLLFSALCSSTGRCRTEEHAWQVGEVGRDWFTVYLIPETLRATGMGAKREGATVNLEIEAQTQVCKRLLAVILLCHVNSKSKEGR